MHTHAFKLKRMYYSLLAVQRDLLLRLDITPARVELLLTMAYAGIGPRREMVQSSIWRALGVRRSTTCRMLAALEQDGYVIRCRHCSDMRQRSVVFTPKARLLLLRVEQLAFRFKFALVVAFAKKKELFAQLEQGLDFARSRFDRSWFQYPRLVKPGRWVRPVPTTVKWWLSD